MEFRKAQENDTMRIMELIRQAKAFLKANGVDHVHGLCGRLRSGPEEVEPFGLEGSRRRSGLHRSFLCHRHELSARLRQGDLELHHVCLHLLCSRSSDVASQAAARLYDDIHVHRHDCRRGSRSSGCAPGNEPAGIHELQHLAWLDVPDSVRHRGVRRGLRLSQPGLLRHVVQNRGKRKGHAQGRLRRDGA